MAIIYAFLDISNPFGYFGILYEYLNRDLYVLQALQFGFKFPQAIQTILAKFHPYKIHIDTHKRTWKFILNI